MYVEVIASQSSVVLWDTVYMWSTSNNCLRADEILTIKRAGGAGRRHGRRRWWLLSHSWWQILHRSTHSSMSLDKRTTTTALAGPWTPLGDITIIIRRYAGPNEEVTAVSICDCGVVLLTASRFVFGTFHLKAPDLNLILHQTETTFSKNLRALFEKYQTSINYLELDIRLTKYCMQIFK